MKTMTTPRTIDQLLADGQRILAEQDRQEREVEERLTIDARSAWKVLREKAVEDLGDLADGPRSDRVPLDPPDNFAHFTDHWTFEFRPWSGPALFVRYEIASGRLREPGDVPTWRMMGECDHGYRGKAIRVQTDFMPSWDADSDTPRWRIKPISWHETDDLAEAVAVCHRAFGAYVKCASACDDREPPKSLQKKERAELSLTDGERAMVLALRQMIEERE